MNRRPWQRTTLSVFGIFIIQLTWRWAVGHLYTLPSTSITAFTSITNNSMYTVSAIVIFMVTGKLIYDWKNQTVSEVKEISTPRVDPKDVDDPAVP